MPGGTFAHARTKLIAGAGAAGLMIAVIGSGGAAAWADTGPFVRAISPNSGMPGTVVGVAGIGFLGGCTTGSPTVLMGLAVEPVLPGATDTLVHFQVPVMLDGRYDIQVVDCNGNASPPVSVDEFQLTLPPRPKVTSIAPKTGTVGTTITVTGTSFRLYCTDGRIPQIVFDDPNQFGDEVTVTDGDPEVVSWTDTKIVLHAPVHPAALVDVLPHDCVGRTTIPSPTDEFTYLAPKVSAVAPASGTAGTLVSVSGSNFRNGCFGSAGPTLIIGGISMPTGSAGVLSETATKIVVNAPPHLAGTVTVQVQDCVGDLSAIVTASKYTYTAPKISSLMPVSGTIGTVVTVTGAGFANGCVSGVSAPTILFGTTTIAAGDPLLVSITATTIKVHAPTAAAGKVDVRVFDCLGDETAVVAGDKFTYTAPKVSTIAPTSGSAGTVVTVKGAGFLTGCSGGTLPSVLVGATSVPGTDPSVSGITATQLTIAVPAQTAGIVDIRIVDCVGDVTAVVAADKFKYV